MNCPPGRPALRSPAMKTPLSLVLLALAVPSLARAADRPKCFSASREGHCIVVQLNGQTAAKLTKDAKKALKALGKPTYRGDEPRYGIATPVPGELALQAAFTPESAAYFGPGVELNAHIVPLEGQAIDTRHEITSDATVQVGGGAAVRNENVMAENRLPPGKYLMAVQLNGSANWDRQVLFFEVAE